MSKAGSALAILATMMNGLWAAFSGAIALPAIRSDRVRSGTPRWQKAPPAPKAAAPARLSPAQQWDKVTGVLSTAIGSAASARDLQAGAAQQLDLATYALYNLFDELSAVMSEPLVREAAVVHRLAPKTRRAQAHALAA